MKLLFLFLILATTVQAHEDDYKTHYLFMWAGNCTHRLIPTYEQKGVPWNFAFSMASQGCGCVIDKFREKHTQDEVLGFSEEERLEKSMYYTQICAGQIKEM